MKKYDLIVIGGGAGNKIIPSAIKKNKKVAIIEKDHLGGTCLNRGCIPSKMMIYPSYIAEEIKNSSKYGFKIDKNIKIDFKSLTEYIHKHVSNDSLKINKKYRKLDNVDHYKAKAEFKSDKVLKVGSHELTAPKIVISVGARPRIAPIPGLENTPYMTSTEALFNKSLPKKLVIIGGGYIAVELGSAYSALGCDVHFLVRGKMVGREDEEIIETFEKEFTKNNNIHKEVSTDRVEYKNKTFTTHFTDFQGKKRRISSDALLVATGVMPNNDTLKLKNTKIKTNKYGFINVDKYLETDVKGVYALGDCVGNYMFRHSANYEAAYISDILFNPKNKKPIKYPPMPHAIFTYPQIAGVGLTEKEAKEKKLKFITVKQMYKDSAMGGDAMRDESGFIKLIIDKNNRKLLGAHIIGPESSNIIHLFIMNMTYNRKIDDMLSMVYIHPALPEVVRNSVRKAVSELSPLKK